MIVTAYFFVQKTETPLTNDNYSPEYHTHVHLILIAVDILTYTDDKKYQKSQYTTVAMLLYAIRGH